MATEELNTIYRKIAEGTDKTYGQIFALEGFFTSFMEFDPVTNETLPITVDDVLHRIVFIDTKENRWWNDRLQHIVDFSYSAVRDIVDILHEKNLREHRITRPEQVHEVDSRCMRWLAKKPGFTIKQKIASEQRMMGVYHTTSIDTSENRLFKAFMTELDELLSEKANICKKHNMSIPNEVERFINLVHTWLKSDECGMIAPWNNVPPNNTLLNDRNYRKIWKSWLSMQKLAENVESDKKHLSGIKTRSLLLMLAAKMNRSKQIRFCQTVLLTKYDAENENIEPLSFTDTDKQCTFIGWCRQNKNSDWQKISLTTGNGAVVIKRGESSKIYSVPEELASFSETESFSDKIITDIFPDISFTAVNEEKFQPCDIAAIDLNSIFPSYACYDYGSKSVLRSGIFDRKFLFQIQKKSDDDKDPYYYSCFRSKYINTESELLKTISLRNIFDKSLLAVSDKKENIPFIEKACSSFAETAKRELRSQHCLYITSDDINDFSPSVNAFKRNMNIAFVRTEILPRSIAALFARFDKIKTKYKDGDKICVRDSYDNYDIVSTIKIVIDKELLEKNPETNGIQFQRLNHCRQEKQRKMADSKVPVNIKEIISDYDGILLNDKFSADDFHFEKHDSKTREPRTNSTGDIIITQQDDTSQGALIYRCLQDNTPELYLWCDVLPRLSMIHAVNKEFVLVEPNTQTVHPVVGKPTLIPIKEHFLFPAGKDFYEFPLIQGGENQQKSDYFAYIEDKNFPLEKDVECDLKLTYTYGKDYPYHLEFRPVDASVGFKSVSVKWCNESHRDYIHVPGPEYITEESWETSCAFRNKKNQTVFELLDQAVLITKCLVNFGFVTCKIEKSITTDIFLTGCHIKEIQCGCNRRAFPKNCQIDVGMEIYCSFTPFLDKNGKTRWGAYDPIPVGMELEKSAYFFNSLPILNLWSQGRSTRDADFPKNLYDTIKKLSDSAVKLLENTTVPKATKDEVCNLLAAFHQDAPQQLFEYLDNIISNTFAEDENDWESLFHHKRLINALGYAVGRAELPSQQRLLKKEIKLLSAKKSEIVNYGIEILGIALWRTRECIFHITAEDIQNILPVAVDTILESLSFFNNDLRFLMNNPLKLRDQKLSISVWYRRQLFLRAVELILALYRVRETKDEAMLALVAPLPDNRATRTLKDLFPDIENFCRADAECFKKVRNNSEFEGIVYNELKSRIQFDIQDDKRDHSIPDYLYALEKYTYGEDCSIKILSIKDDDQA